MGVFGKSKYYGRPYAPVHLRCPGSYGIFYNKYWNILTDDAEIGRLSLKSGGGSFTLKSGDSRLDWESWNLCTTIKAYVVLMRNIRYCGDAKAVQSTQLIGCLRVDRLISADRATNMSFDLLIVVRSADFKNYFAKGRAGFMKCLLCKPYMRSFHNFANCKSTVWYWLSVLVLRKIRRK